MIHKILVGLGNPGTKYLKNRHNVGHMFIDFLERHPELVSGSRNKFGMTTLKTDCYMNQSGQFVKKIISNLKLEISNLVIAHDDLDIPLGKFKIQFGTGPKLHNGILSIEQSLDTSSFWRIRIGVDARTAENRTDGETYALQNFMPDEQSKLQDVFTTILQQLKIANTNT